MTVDTKVAIGTEFATSVTGSTEFTSWVAHGTDFFFFFFF